jgi:chorismate synthase
MPTLEYQTAGESHGPALVVIVSGLPAGLTLDLEFINSEMTRRQGGYGRGARQRIESDTVQVLSGTRAGRTIGSPLAMMIPNRDSRIDDADRTPPLFRPRPGHADLAGSLKYITTDCRDVLERASARETAARTAAGAVARCLLREFDIDCFGFVRSIHSAATQVAVTPETWRELREKRDTSETYCPDLDATLEQCHLIRRCKADRDTAGGLIETHIFGCPPGLGSCMRWQDKLDARLAFAAMSIQAIKSVEIGLGKDAASRLGSQVHDPIAYDASQRETAAAGFVRESNNAGGTEGGMSNGQPLIIRAAMKPISTLLQGMPSVDLNTRKPEMSAYERSDVCAVPAASVVLENVCAFEVARAFCEKFGGDTMTELRVNHENYLRLVRSLPLDPPTMTIA